MTIALIIITCIISFMAFSNHDTMNKLIFNSVAVSEREEWWRFITSGFVHGSVMHLAFNMLALYSFGAAVEQAYATVFGSSATVKFLLLYFGGMIVAMIP